MPTCSPTPTSPCQLSLPSRSQARPGSLASPCPVLLRAPRGHLCPAGPSPGTAGPAAPPKRVGNDPPFGLSHERGWGPPSARCWASQGDCRERLGEGWIGAGEAGQHRLSHHKVRPASKSCPGNGARVAFVARHHLFPSVGCHFAAAMQEEETEPGRKGHPRAVGPGSAFLPAEWAGATRRH